ncbi:MAG: hypothetical protein LUE12_00045 [Ruminococcus sp.]|nr:hypothetical protein [Ruminococcus sp.]
MNNKALFLCTGADRRQLYAAKKLNDIGIAEVLTFRTDGTAENVRSIDSLDELERSVDLLLLPMPCSNGLNIPVLGRQLSCESFLNCLGKSAIVTGGAMNTAMIEFFNSHGFDTADYYRREELVVKNCIPTAEGALSIALNELDVTVRGTSAGDVSQRLALRFSAQ